MKRLIQNPQPGDRCRIDAYNMGNRTHDKHRAPAWANQYTGTIIQLNRSTVTVRLDDYPEETIRARYYEIREE